ncbi:MAG: beta-galactosidase, partial [Pseudomonadota bacterium]
GPRTDTKTTELSIRTPMGPDLPGTDVTVALTESLPPSEAVALQNGGAFRHWFEHLEGDAAVHLQTATGQPAIMGNANLRYLAGWPDPDTFDQIIAGLCQEAGLPHHTLPSGLRIRETATHRFVFNYAPTLQIWKDTEIPPAGVHWEPL